MQLNTNLNEAYLGGFRTKEEWCFHFLNIASHSGDIQVFVKKLVTLSVVLKESKSQNIEYL